MSDVKPRSMRDALGDAVVELGAEMPGLVVVGADTTESIQTLKFGKAFPDRFFNVGIAEQNMIGVSAGFALYGKTALCGTYAVFIERAIDQIRNTIAYCNLDVKIVGAHAGLVTGPDGGSHQTIEDIAIMRSIPNIKVVGPSDYTSAKALIKEAAKTPGPFYIRIIRPAIPAIYETAKEFKIGRAEVLKDGSDVSIIANGVMVYDAITAADRLAKEGTSARVIDCHTIKPLDRSAILSAARDTGGIVTAEDHNVYGGLGSAVSELLSSTSPKRMRMVAAMDKFGESGEGTEVLTKHGLSSNAICKAVADILNGA